VVVQPLRALFASNAAKIARIVACHVSQNSLHPLARDLGK
jgi:hypothetical protein